MDDSEDDVRELINKGRKHESIDDDFLDEDEGRRYINYLDKALKLEPANNSIYLFKARVYKHMHMYNNAVDAYQKYLEKDQDWIEDFLDISECYNRLGSNHQAKIFREYYDDPGAYTERLIRRRTYYDQKKSNEEFEDSIGRFLIGILMGIFIAIILALIIGYSVGVYLIPQSALLGGVIGFILYLILQSALLGGIIGVISLVVKTRKKLAIIGAILGVIVKSYFFYNIEIGRQFPIYWAKMGNQFPIDWIICIIIGTLTGYIGGVIWEDDHAGTVKVSTLEPKI